MEDSWQNWISSLEMGDDNSNGQSHINSLDQDKFLTGIVQQPPNYCSFQSFHHSSTMSYNNVFPTTSTMGSSSLSYEDATSFDERHGKLLNSSSSFIISQDVAPHMPAAPSSSTFILSFENSTVEPRPNSPKHFGGEATCSSLLSSERTLSSDHITKPKAKQGTKKYRSSSENQDHIMAERKRRQGTY
ncbi:transcription factor bHLH18 [Spatholobus suberectus]|nr:transcription factor bHLH18 [Spatholobus suberectus]